jgi:hypothetical protein
MHDSGPLVKPIEGGIMAALIGAVETAKAYNDEYLTSVIEAEKSTLPIPQQKRAKTDDRASAGLNRVEDGPGSL